MKKLFSISLIALVAMLFVGCAPMSKDSYMKQFGKLMDEAASIYSSCTESEWANITEDYEKFSGEYYDKFEKELSTSEKLTVVGYEAKMVGYAAGRGISTLFSGEDEK